MVHAICRAVLLTTAFVFCFGIQAYAQTAAPKTVVIGSLENKPNAILYLNPEDKNQGFLLPQLTTAQRLSIRAASPGDDGLMVYDKEQNDVYLWRNNAWAKAKLGEGAVSAPQLINTIQFANNEIRISEAGNTHTQSLNTLQVNGDVSGAINATNVSKIQGNAVSNAKLATTDNGKAMVWNGTQWTAQKVADGSTISSVQLVNNDLSVTEAGNTLTQNLNGLNVAGDVTGTINTAVVGKIQGNAISNAKLAAADNGKALVWNGTQWTAQNVVDNSITNETITGVQLVNNDLRVTEAGNTLTQNLNGLTVAGDMTGTINTAVVGKIQGNAVANTKLVAADNGKAMVWNGTQWAAQNVVDGSVTNETITGVQLLNNELRIAEAGTTSIQNLNGLNVTGDVTGTINSSVVTKIQGNPVSNAKLLGIDNGKALVWNGTQWVAQNVVDGDGSSSNETITGVQLVNNDLRITEAGATSTQNLNGLNVAGDVTGTINTSVVTKIQGNAVSNTKLAAGDNGKILVWNGAQWVAQTVAAVTPSTQYAALDPSAFSLLKERGKADKSNIVMFGDDDSFVTVNKRDEGRIIIAPLSLPQGVTMQNITLHYMVRQSGTIRFRLLRKTLSGGNEEILNWVSTGVSNAVRTIALTNFNGFQTIQNNGFSYRVEITLNPPDDANEAGEADHRVYGVNIQYVP